MPSLSEKYNRDLIMCAVRVGNPKLLKILVLSSVEMSAAFMSFMKSVEAKYCRPYLYLTLHSIDHEGLRCSRGYSTLWITSFIRRLSINHDVVLDTGFFERLQHCKKLINLNFASLRFSKPPSDRVADLITSLASLSPGVSVNTNHLNVMACYLKNFDGIYFKVGGVATESFNDEVERSAVRVLQIVIPKNPFSISGDTELDGFKEQLQHIQTVYCTSHESMNSIKRLFVHCEEFFPNAKVVKMNFGFEWYESLPQLKASFYTLVEALSEFAERMIVDVTTAACIWDLGDRAAEVKDFFSSDEFDITYHATYPSVPTMISNRKKQISKTLKVSFTLR